MIELQVFLAAAIDCLGCAGETTMIGLVAVLGVLGGTDGMTNCLDNSTEVSDFALPSECLVPVAEEDDDDFDAEPLRDDRE